MHEGHKSLQLLFAGRLVERIEATFEQCTSGTSQHKIRQQIGFQCLYTETQDGIVGRRHEEIHGTAEEGNHKRRSLSLCLSGKQRRQGKQKHGDCFRGRKGNESFVVQKLPTILSTTGIDKGAGPAAWAFFFFFSFLFSFLSFFLILAKFRTIAKERGISLSQYSFFFKNKSSYLEQFFFY